MMVKLLYECLSNCEHNLFYHFLFPATLILRNNSPFNPILGFYEFIYELLFIRNGLLYNIFLYGNVLRRKCTMNNLF